MSGDEFRKNVGELQQYKNDNDELCVKLEDENAFLEIA
jgi:hypothetical protein